MSEISLADAVTLAYDALMACGHRVIADTLTDAFETTIPLVEWVDSSEGLLVQALHHIAETNEKNAAEIDIPAVKGLLTESAASWRGHATKLSALVEALPRQDDEQEHDEPCQWFVNDATTPSWCCGEHRYDGTGDFPATGEHPEACPFAEMERQR